MQRLLVLLLVVTRASAGLTPAAYERLPIGSVTPKGWLLKQLKLQAEGLSGHLAQFWNDVMHSSWIGGGGDGGLHERTPYWLNGVVPLAFLLKNAGIEELQHVTGIYKAPHSYKEKGLPICDYGTDMYGEDIAGGEGYSVATAQQCQADCKNRQDCLGFVVNNCTSPMTCWLKGGNGPTRKSDCRCYGKNIPTPKPVNIMQQVEQYISHALSTQNPDGWLGPQVNKADGTTYWGPSNALQALYMYAEGSKDADKFKNASQAVLLHLLEQKRRMATVHLNSWAKARWIDMALTAEWLLDNADVGAHQQDLLDLIGMLHDQGADWEQWFEHWTGDAGTHNVNNAQGLKSAAVYARYNSTATYEGHSLLELSKRRMAHLDETYGLPTGMYNGDEHFPTPSTRSPSHGIELCGVVEAMFSYNTMFSIQGDVSFADRAERIAMNALPATWASPKGGDMWAHQYLQAVNEINAIKADPHVWQTDGDMSETYGLEPNYGCCTANFNQGWPKYASMLMYQAPDGGAVVALYAPASAKLPNGVLVDVDTEYPFEDSAVITITTARDIPVYFRIPSWALEATVNGEKAVNGTMWSGKASKGASKFTINFSPKVRLEEWDNGAVSVHRGALMYALPIQPNYTVYAHHFGTPDQSSDYYLLPQSKWQYALDADPRTPSASLKFVQNGYKDGAAPFNHSGYPTAVDASLRFVPSWAKVSNSAAPPPKSPACEPNADTCGPAEKLQLVPYGATELRIGELPLASFASLNVPEPEERVTTLVV